jgi:hypothetical protein
MRDESDREVSEVRKSYWRWPYVRRGAIVTMSSRRARTSDLARDPQKQDDVRDRRFVHCQHFGRRTHESVYFKCGITAGGFTASERSLYRK